ncbi:MAG: FIST C-terminal domain-containing protein [Methylobacterium organophilum]|nr:FIST C-terminal domain-containing protein [Methylobacterium organophilum]
MERAGRVARGAAARLDPEQRAVAGAFVIYCGGCRLAVGERINDKPQEIAEHLSGQPFLGCFTFGEQGRLLGRDVHSNLMISASPSGSRSDPCCHIALRSSLRLW